MKQGEQSSLLYRATLTLFFCVLFVITMYFAQGILIPLTTAALLAMLLLPMVRRFEKWKMGKFLSIFCSLLIVLGIVVIVVYILSAQVVSFTADLPTIQQHLNERFAELQNWIEDVSGLTGEEQVAYVQKAAT